MADEESHRKLFTKPDSPLGDLPAAVTTTVGNLPTGARLTTGGRLLSTNSPVGDLPAAVTTTVGHLPIGGRLPTGGCLPTTKLIQKGSHALDRAHPAAMEGAQHGDVLGGHAKLGARPKEGRHQGYGHTQHEEDYHKVQSGGGHAHHSVQYGVAGAEALKVLRQRALGDDLDAYIPGIWNGLF